MARVLLPVPALDFDPSEVAVSWKGLKRRGHEVVFATPEGKPGAADDIMLTGEGLDPWGFLPGLSKLRALGLLLRANADARAAYGEMIADPAFQAPIRWDAIDPGDFDGLLLGGGHRARGMRPFLESPDLQRATAAFFADGKPVGAICHGVLLAARSKGADGRSVLYGRKTTALTWRQEGMASALARVGRFWDADYYRTYLDGPGEPKGYMSVQQEVTRALARRDDFLEPEPGDPDFKFKTGAKRDSPTDSRPAFVVQDGRYVSARWPGDAHSFAARFGAVLETAKS